MEILLAYSRTRERAETGRRTGILFRWSILTATCGFARTAARRLSRPRLEFFCIAGRLRKRRARAHAAAAPRSLSVNTSRKTNIAPLRDKQSGRAPCPRSSLKFQFRSGSSIREREERRRNKESERAGGRETGGRAESNVNHGVIGVIPPRSDLRLRVAERSKFAGRSLQDRAAESRARVRGGGGSGEGGIGLHRSCVARLLLIAGHTYPADVFVACTPRR